MTKVIITLWSNLFVVQNYLPRMVPLFDWTPLHIRVNANQNAGRLQGTDKNREELKYLVLKFFNRLRWSTKYITRSNKQFVQFRRC